MAVLFRRGVSLPWNICVLLLWIHITIIWILGSQGTFVLRNHEENEVIFVGERITLECRSPSNVGNPQFRLLDSQDIVLVDQGFNSFADRHFGFIDPNEGGANFQIDITAVIQNRYLCEISGDNSFLSTEEIDLNVLPRESPQCYVNTSTSVTTGVVVGLSCYRELGLASGFRWRQILRDGTINEQLPLEYSSLINSFKRKLSTYIRASSADDGSKFECVIMDSGSEKTCTSGEIFVQQNQEVELMFSPEILPPLDRGDMLEVECSPSLANYDVSWLIVGNFDDADAEIDLSDGTLRISIPIDTTLTSGDALIFICQATFDEFMVPKQLTLNVVFTSTTKRPSTSTSLILPSRSTIQPTNTSDRFNNSPMDDNMATNDPDDENDSDFTIYFIIAGVVAVVLVAVIAVILIAICMTKQQDYSSKEERKFGNAAYDSDFAEEANTGYSAMDISNRNGPSVLPEPDVVPYSDVSRGRHVIEIDEEEIYDDSKDWKSDIEFEA